MGGLHIMDIAVYIMQIQSIQGLFKLVGNHKVIKSSFIIDPTPNKMTVIFFASKIIDMYSISKLDKVKSQNTPNLSGPLEAYKC